MNVLAAPQGPQVVAFIAFTEAEGSRRAGPTGAAPSAIANPKLGRPNAPTASAPVLGRPLGDVANAGLKAAPRVGPVRPTPRLIRALRKRVAGVVAVGPLVAVAAA